MKQLNSKIVFMLAAIALNSGIATGKTTTSGSRLIAQSHYDAAPATGSLVAYDSISYIYPNATSTFYSEELNYLYNVSAWEETVRNDYTYNTNNKLTYMQNRNWNTATSSYTNGGLTFYTLNGSGYCIRDSGVLWVPATSSYRNNTLDSYTVNTAGQVTDNVYKEWDISSGAMINTFHYANTYNSHGNPVVMLTQDWDATVHWMDQYKSTYAYDGTGTRLETLTGEESTSPGSPLQLIYQNVYTLNTDGTIATCLSNLWNSSTSSYHPSMRITYAYDGSKNNTLQTQEQWDVATAAYKPSQQYVSTYNSYNEMTSQTEMRWNGTAYATPYSRDNYYYAAYTLPAGVANTVALDAQLSLAPIPTTGELHIALQWTDPQAFTAIVTDMNGRQCHTFSEPACTGYTGNINLSNLPSGNYVLSVFGEQGASVSRIIVIKH